MTTAGLTALDRGNSTEGLHYLAKAVFFAERMPQDYWGSKNRDELELIRSSLPRFAAAGKPGDEFLKVITPARYRLGAVAERAAGLVSIRHFTQRLEIEPSFFGRVKTNTLSSPRYLRWNSAAQEQIRKLKEGGIWKWPAARFEDGREVLFDGKVALITPTSKEVFAQIDEFLRYCQSSTGRQKGSP